MATSRRADAYEFRNARGKVLMAFTGAGRIGLYSSNRDGASPTNYNLRKAMRAAPLETAPLAA